MKKVNTLIVGQGLAGSVFSFMLHREGIPFRVIDAGEEQSASRVAAGMYTPITGKRKTIHPVTIEQIPFAESFYREVELLLDCRLLHKLPVYQVFASAAERAAFTAKTMEGNYSNFASLAGVRPGNVQQEFGGAEINSSGWLDCKAFIERWREWLQQHDLLETGEFDFSHFDSIQQPHQYGGVQFENMVFCEGYKGMNNPFFVQRPIVPCKGEVLTVSATGLRSDLILKKAGIYLVPLNDGTFKVGATYKWGSSAPEPDTGGRGEIEALLKTLLSAGYEVVKHESGIRPTTKNREVIATHHPVFRYMYMLNGLGTKGVLNAPWWANKLLQKYFR